MPELMWRAYQEVKLAECDAFEANDEFSSKPTSTCSNAGPQRDPLELDARRSMW